MTDHVCRLCSRLHPGRAPTDKLTTLPYRGKLCGQFPPSGRVVCPLWLIRRKLD